MTYRQLGASGLVVSTAGLGCNSFGATLPPDEVARVVGAALEAGITFFDTADIYGGEPGQSEELLGRALAGRRDDVVVATKFGMDARGLNGEDHGVRGSRRYIRRAVEGSLRRLGTDHIDLYQLHRPDPVTPWEETLETLDDLVREGKVRYVGCSNVTGWQLVDADWTARTAGLSAFISVQNEYSLLSRGIEAEVVPAAAHVGAGILPYYPLASGLLTGKYRRGEPAPAGSRLERRPERLAAADFDRIEALEAVAERAGVVLLTLALGGLAAQPGVASVIAGARTPEQVRANVAATLWEPDAETLVAIDEASPGPTPH
ncbi:aldo/keto reductase [uncultured Georgenia sp.]|uniref:aldo/keto reductase n=1 Tax=uncultured Georgenia sp. TaxID=378209 RepID=UPI00260FADD8|nr:aldo/keto reductase [uncultured Georgenia sp.]HLV05455.1 aldo/keto reductase [Actinomycetaceae bacterium]